MAGYVLRRALGILPTLFAIVTVSFFVIRLAPGGPFDEERALPPEVKANLEAAYGLDAPLSLQYARYVAGLARFDFGPSFKWKDVTVAELIGTGLPVSAMLGLTALVLALLVGLPLGIYGALRSDPVSRATITAFAALGVALPNFVVGPFLALVLGLRWDLLPVAGWIPGDPSYLVMPAITLALPVAAYLARLMRASLLETLASPHIRAARARGIGERRVVWAHALRPAMVPVVGYLGPAAAFIVTGSLAVESIFALPGIGRFLVDGALNRDYTLVMGMIILYGIVTVLCNLIADLLVGWLDPRVRDA
jgi:oligopeptide transport system permease protein